MTPYLDDHPGGAEVVLEFAGKDADSMFEDVGHSKEARTTMKKYLKGPFKGSSQPAAKSGSLEKATVKKSESGFMNPVALMALFFAIFMAVYFNFFKTA